MKLGITLISTGLILAPMLVPALASAQTGFEFSNNIGSCTEDSQFQPNYLLNGAQRHDHYLDLTISSDPSTGSPILNAELGTGSAPIEYELSANRPRSNQRLNSLVDWRGNLQNQGPGQFTSSDGVGLTLVEQPDERPASPLLGNFVLPITDTSVYRAEITRPGGQTVRLTCQLSRRQLAQVDRSARRGIVVAGPSSRTVEENRAAKSAPGSESPVFNSNLNAAANSGARKI